MAEGDGNYVMVCPKAVNADMNANVNEDYDKLCELRHPRTNKAATFICTNDSVHEVNHFRPKTSCWLIDESVRSDGTLLVATKLDPLFLALPYLFHAAQSSNGKKFMLLDQTLVDEEYEAVEKRLLPVFTSPDVRSQLEHVADVKEIEDSESPAVRYNESKTLAWLERKVRAFATALKERNIDIHGSRSASLIVTSKDLEDSKKDSKSVEAEDAISQDLLRYCADVVSDYLSYAMNMSLTKHLKIVDDAPPSTDTSAPPMAKKRKLSANDEAEEPSEDYAKIATPFSPSSGNKKPATKAAKDLAKASKGTTSVMSFFKAAPKAKK